MSKVVESAPRIDEYKESENEYKEELSTHSSKIDKPLIGLEVAHKHHNNCH